VEVSGWLGTKWRRNIAENFNCLNWVAAMLQTTDRFATEHTNCAFHKVHTVQCITKWVQNSVKLTSP